MAKKYLLALDAGTGSVRAALFDTEGNQLGCVAHEWEHKEDVRFPNSMDFDWVLNWQLTKECIKGVLNETGINPANISGISTTSMREGIVLYDAFGNEIWACANVDARSTDEVAQLIQSNPEMERLIYAESGQTYALGALPRLLWVKNKMPEIYDKVATLGMFNDWLIYKLTGIIAVEPSNGSTTGIFDLKKRTWDPEIAKKCGLRADIFPKVVESGTVLAGVSREASLETGLCENTPVIVGGGDAQLGCIGVGVVDENQAAVFGGSFWQYEFNTSSGETDPACRVRVNCHAVPGLWQYEALAFKPGLVMRWFRDGFCQLEKQQGITENKDPYYLMDKKAAEIPAGCYGMMCTFSDVMNFISWKHASPTFTNFNLDFQKFNRYTFYRSILENTALVTKGHLELVYEATGNMPSEIIFANGAAKSSLWCQILADVLGLPVKVPVIKEATALGAAIVAGVGIGVFDNISITAKKFARIDKMYEPDMENYQVYSALYQKWRKVYAAQLALSDQKLTKNMWIAPGL